MHKEFDFKKIVYLILALWVIVDLYTCFDFYVHTQIMGDLAAIALPDPWYKDILENPFGISVLLSGESYAATNRFWAHYLTHKYFHHIPLWLQGLGMTPVDSIYVACGIIKLLTQIGLTLVLSKWVIGKKSIFSLDTIVLFAFISAFFFTADTHHRAFDIKSSMTIIDQSVIYTIFYGVSLFFLLLYFHPFLQRIWGNKTRSFHLSQHIWLFFLSFVVSFNGPSNLPTILLLCPLILLGLWLQNYRNTTNNTLFSKVVTAIQGIPKNILFHFSWIILLSLYSFYLGSFNLENPTEMPSLMERYDLLFEGLYYEYFWNAYHPAPLMLLFILTLINIIFITKVVEKKKKQQYINNFLLFMVFATCYILLLPLGGYRSYRPFIIRYDIVMPITIGLLFLFFHSCYLLAQHLKGKKQIIYIVPWVVLSIFLSIVDRVPNEPTRQCEYKALKQFSTAQETIVELPACNILAWGLIQHPSGLGSETVCKLLYHWRVIEDENKRYYNTTPQ